MQYLLFLLLVFGASNTEAKRLNPERYYQERWCNGKGETEFVLPDKTRVDCLTSSHAWEVDFANKWAEAHGQAIHYMRMTGKRGGVILIIEKPEDVRFFHLLKGDIDAVGTPIDVIMVMP